MKNEHIFKNVREKWQDYLEPESRIDKEKFDSNNLLECYEEWGREEEAEWGREEAKKVFSDSYPIAAKLLKKYKIPTLSEKEINEFIRETKTKEFIRETKTKEFKWAGRFISAMINELYEDRKIYLPIGEVNFIGYLNKDKKIVVKGNCGDWIGENMTGGNIVVKGDCGEGIGYGMKSGEIVVEGDCGESTGYGMKGGKIRIYGNNFNPKEQISEFAEKGEIYHKNKLVWKDGEFIGLRCNIKKALRYIKGDEI